MATSSQSTSNGDTSDSMRDLAAAIVAAMRQPKQLTSSQQSVELKFRLIRNGLGNFGGHGDDFGDRALIKMTHRPHVNRGELEFVDLLPDRARLLLISHRGKEDKVHRRLGQTPPLSIDQVGADPITLVEVLDEFNVPIAAGIPTVDASTGRVVAPAAVAAE